MSVRNTWWWVFGAMFCAVGTWLTDDPVEENTLRIALLICVATFAILTKLDGWSNKMGGRE